ncbi:MAG TPA: transposase [Candidatus Polarisedimenticolia bacterium]|nr:transposase [Candidatus Polarisedimenticolia bacterium]
MKTEHGGVLEPGGSWLTVASFAREGAQRLLQQLLEEELSDHVSLAAGKEDPAARGTHMHRSGHGRPRRLRTPAGEIEIRRPRLRGPNPSFRSRVLPHFKQRARDSGELQLGRYLEGLAETDFDMAVSGLLGDVTLVSMAARERLRPAWLVETAAWKNGPLSDLDVAYVIIDAIAPGRAGDLPSLIVVIGVLADGARSLLLVERAPAQGAAAVIRRKLLRRGLRYPQLVLGGGLRMAGAAAEAGPEAAVTRTRCSR